MKIRLFNFLKKNISYFACTLLLMIGFSPSVLNALPYHPMTPVTFDSLHYAVGSEDNNNLIQWEIVPETNPKESLLKFLRNQNDYCKIVIQTDVDDGISIKLYNESGKLIHHSFQAFISVSGFFVPFNMIDFDSLAKNKDHFNIVQTAGGRKFSNLFYVTIEKIELKEAIEKQWVPTDFKLATNSDEADQLYLYIVRSEGGAFLYKQLWQKDASWWLYEETQSTKSWRR